MQRHGVVLDVVDALQDIDLPVHRPCPTAQHPECRPDTADGARHVCDIRDEETLVVGFLGGDAHRGAAARGVLGGAVDADVEAVGGWRGGADQLLGDGILLGDVLDEAGGRVLAGEEVEGREEVAGVVGVEEGVCARPACEEGQSEGGGDGVHLGWCWSGGDGLRCLSD